MNNRKINQNIVFWIVGVVLVAVITVGMWLAYDAFSPKPKATDKLENADREITVNVIDKDGETTQYVVKTHQDYLKGVMDEAAGLTYETKDGMVMSVNGQRADYVLDGAYWGFFVNGEYCNYGIEDQVANDGDVFEIRYTKA